jgi:hypothetical protein
MRRRAAAATGHTGYETTEVPNLVLVIFRFNENQAANSVYRSNLRGSFRGQAAVSRLHRRIDAMRRTTLKQSSAAVGLSRAILRADERGFVNVEHEGFYRLSGCVR